MSTSHQRASRKSKKSSGEHGARGRPCKIKSVRLTMSSQADENDTSASHDNDDSRGNLNNEGSAQVEGTESGEDELYGRQVLDDDGLDDAAVAKKPRQKPKSTAHEKSP
jgi:hypothetical protein